MLSEQSFFDNLYDVRAEVVPVVGAGLARDAGAPSSLEIARGLMRFAGNGWLDANSELEGRDLFSVADALANSFSEEWVQQKTAQLIAEVPLLPTTALKALAKTKSKLVVTTNYDPAVERSAQEIGLAVTSLTVSNFEITLTDASDSLRVLHLHGTANAPNTIVLGKKSYETLLKDERAQLVMRYLASRRRLIFLGHSLDPREAHLRRDLLWAERNSQEPSSFPRHLLLTSWPDVEDSVLLERAETLRMDAGVELVAFPDPLRQNNATRRASNVIAGPSNVERDKAAVAVAQESVDPHYLPLPVAPSDQVKDDYSQGAYIAQIWQEGYTYASELDTTERRLLLQAPGGFGKTQELIQIGQRSEFPAYFRPLSGVQVGHPSTEPEIVFTTWMNSALGASKGTVPKLTLDLLRNEAFVFLLDGLDEVAADLRNSVIKVINEVSSNQPQHRWVVSSRPLPAVAELKAFVPWTPMPDEEWLQRYIESRGISETQFSAVTAGVSGLQDLITIPAYAAAIVDSIGRGEPLPSSAAELMWGLVDSRIAPDTRIAVDPKDLRPWLDRLALLLQLLSTTQITTEDLLALRLHADLPDLVPSQELISELAIRALVTDVSGAVKFPANIIQEALAVRAILNAGSRGLRFMQNHVLIELPVSDPTGRPVRAVRPGWVNTLEKLLPLASKEWKEIIRAFDLLLVARTTASDEPRPVRHWAIWAIWQTYSDRQIWLDRSSRSTARNDFETLIKLARVDLPPGFLNALDSALVDSKPTERGNALQLLVALQGTSRLETVRIAIRDSDPVVRRMAAYAAFELNAKGLAQDLWDQGMVDDDELAAQSLVDFAIELAEKDTATAFALSVPARLADRALSTLSRRLSRLELLELLSYEPLNVRLLDTLVGFVTRKSERDSWSAQEVARLTQIVTDHNMFGFAGVNSVLGLHPVAAIAGRLTRPPGELLWSDIGRLVAQTELKDLDKLQNLLSSTPNSLLEALGTGLTDAIDSETLDQTRLFISERLAFKNSNGNGPQPLETKTPPPHSPLVRQSRDTQRNWPSHLNSAPPEVGKDDASFSAPTGSGGTSRRNSSACLQTD